MKFQISRRQLLFGSATIATLAGTAAWWKQSPTNQIAKPEKTLNAIIDTILPSDDFGGGLDLQIHTTLTNDMHSQPGVVGYVKRVINATDQRALRAHRRAFYKLDVDARESLLTEQLSSTAPNQSRLDLRRLRARLLSYYYSSAAGQSSLGYQLPAHYTAYQSQ